MKPSEMTNERIAEELIATIPNLNDEAWSCTDADDILREAAARLRKIDITIVAQKAKAAAEGYADGREEVADLRRRLKVANEALYDFVNYAENHAPLEAGLNPIIDKARAAIREEGDMK